ncbi:hypothetical protein BJY04DRAFT_231483 [Aspergillus karnatakaensis]|uniref:uncharacterized protein n=1 Tax=Aspergillus karnatakaensis TaxID=1810916 RepID=UPI003CCE4CFF
MGWHQVSPTRWECPLVGMEDYFAYTEEVSANRFCGRQHYIVSSTFKVDLNLPGDKVEALKRAWKHLRFQQPQIAATTEDGNKVYEVPSSTADLDNWANATLVVSDALNAESLIETAPLFKQSTLYYFPHSSELLLRVHHQINDGIGSLQAMHIFFNALASPNSPSNPDPNSLAWGTEPPRLSPPIDSFLNPTPNQPPTPSQSEKAIAKLTAYTSALPSLGPISAVGEVPPGKCLFLHRALSPTLTTAIIKRCKEKKITVTTAVHAAYVAMLQSLGDHSPCATALGRTKRYTGLTVHNMRRYVEGRSQPREATVALYYSPQFISIPVPEAYGTVCEVLKAHYRDSLEEQVKEYNEAFTRTLAAVVRSEEYQNAPIPTDATVSSLGVLERYVDHSYGCGDGGEEEEEGEGKARVEILDYRLGCDIVLGMNIVHFWTWRGQLHFNYSFNDAYEEEGMVGEYLAEMERVLRVELVGEGVE